MPQNNTYKYLSIVLAVIALIFAVLYFIKPSETITDTLGDIQAKARDCQAKILVWQSTNSAGSSGTTSIAAQADLNDILNQCKNDFENSQEKL